MNSARAFLLAIALLIIAAMCFANDNGWLGAAAIVGAAIVAIKVDPR